MLPGFANAHTHAFHRALRGRTHDGGGTFWTWRERMYAVAARLDPDTYLALARAAYAEMALAGRHRRRRVPLPAPRPDGRPYADPNAMGHALRPAAADAGVRLTLLDTCYLAGGVDGRPVEGVQRRFSDGDAQAWAERVAALRDGPGLRIGVAAHSVRAVPRGRARRSSRGRPTDARCTCTCPSSPPRTPPASRRTGCTPTGLLAAEGAARPAHTAVHATHLTAADVALLVGSGTAVCLCPTTERTSPTASARPGRCATRVQLALGGDQHAVIDLFAEARGLEMHERLATGERGRFPRPRCSPR